MGMHALVLLLIQTNLVEQIQADKTLATQLTMRGKEAILKCDGEAYYWRYQGNVTFEIFDGHYITENRNKTYGIFGVKNDLIIHNATYQEAGKYTCYGRSASVISEVNVIVIDKNISCQPSPRNIYLPVTINCSFHYEAHSPCLIRLLLYDNESRKEFPSTTSDHIAGHCNKYLWLIINESGGLSYSSRYLLRIVFNCEVDHHSSKESIVFDTDIIYIIPPTNIHIQAAIAIGVGISSVFVITTVVSFRLRKCNRKTAKLPSIRNRRKPLPKPPLSGNVLSDIFTSNENTDQNNVNELSLCLPYSTVSELYVHNRDINFHILQCESGNIMETAESTYDLETANDNIFY